jgi:hypothetical protein
MEVAGVQISARLAPFELLAAEPGGATRSVRLGSLWADQPVVLVFIRHFG